MVDAELLISAVLLVGAFILAIKVLKTAFEVATVAGISAGFYAVMANSFSYPLTVEAVLRFAALGTGLYLAYSVVFPLLGVGWDIVTAPYNLWKWISGKLGDAKRSRRLSKIEEKLNRHDERLEEDNEDSETDTKEVVLDKVAGEDED